MIEKLTYNLKVHSYLKISPIIQKFTHNSKVHPIQMFTNNSKRHWESLIACLLVTEQVFADLPETGEVAGWGCPVYVHPSSCYVGATILRHE